jgi:hypothetical protein
MLSLNPAVIGVAMQRFSMPHLLCSQAKREPKQQRSDCPGMAQPVRVNEAMALKPFCDPTP